jgi:hypothetical protein
MCWSLNILALFLIPKPKSAAIGRRGEASSAVHQGTSVAAERLT